MRAPQLLIQAESRHQVFLERLKTGNMDALKAMLVDTRRAVLGQLSGQNLTEWSRTKLQKQLAAIDAIIAGNYADWATVLDGQIRELALYEAGFEIRALEKVATVNFTLPTPEQLAAAIGGNPLSIEGPDKGKLLESFLKDWLERDRQRYQGVINAGYAQGQTTQGIVAELRNQFDRSLGSLETMARTSLQHAAQQTRQATAEANSDIIKKIRIVATLDSRTSSQCASLDGREFDIDKGPRPPFHPNCRTTTTYVLDDRFAVLREGATRSSRGPDGVEPAPANQTYYAWLKQQPKEFVNEAIGPQRAKLLLDGGLSAERFAELGLSKQFMPLSLDQMRQIEPLAFDRAGL